MSRNPPMPDSLDKTYNPAALEARIYESWESDGCFKAGRVAEADPYTIIIPPPNVTGSLHMGHALNNTLQDILCRFERMRGRDVLWQPGTDHAGIATQMVVERQLAEQNKPSRREMGREAFIKQVWQWKETSGSTITGQLRRLGASCDWSRERFTMDEGLSKAVLQVFIKLYEENLIYKDKRLVNWDPTLLTAISDLEVETREMAGHLWHFNYPLADGSGHITVATTRPETMLGDSGVAVHPDDSRFTNLIGKKLLLPIVGREIPIIADEYADPEQGSGAVKITPAHDFNDFEVGKRHDLPLINMFDQHACIDLSDAAFDTMADKTRWHGLAREAARQTIIDTMDALGLLAKIDAHVLMVPYGDRSGQIIEPWLTDQWYVNAAELAKPAMAAVRQGEAKFVPQNWQKTYFEWMENIQPWCISRQLWWGHQIPAWYAPDGTIFVAENEAAAQAKATAHFGAPTALTRDEDVLDTWFSSALWPFSTLGGPEQTADVERYYKTDVLVTGFDIIFFWVARMMMMGLHFMEEVPFHTIYIHALVRDEKGAKMSKSKGNVIDPLDLIDTYGADALRFTLAAMAAMGRDIKLSESRVAGYRNFGTKLWNAARFCEMNGCFAATDFDPAQAQTPLTKWLVGEAVRAQNAVQQALENYRFNEAANHVYHFIWHSFCDWYVELAKPALQGETADDKQHIQAASQWALNHALHLLHPFMPFVTEELWHKTGMAGKREKHLMLDAWPSLSDDLINAKADAEIDWLIAMISEIRSIRAELNVPASAQISLMLIAPTETLKQARAELTRDNLIDIDSYIQPLKKLAGLSNVTVTAKPPKTGAVQSVVGETMFALSLANVIDFATERARLTKEIGKVESEINKLHNKLNNAGFLSKAPAHVVAENQARLQAETTRRDKLQAALARL